MVFAYTKAQRHGHHEIHVDHEDSPAHEGAGCDAARPKHMDMGTDMTQLKSLMLSRMRPQTREISVKERLGL